MPINAQTKALEAKIADLEIKLAYQEETLEALEKTLAQQTQDNLALERKFKIMTEYLKGLKTEGEAIRPLNEETPPPHY